MRMMGVFFTSDVVAAFFLCTNHIYVRCIRLGVVGIETEHHQKEMILYSGPRAVALGV